MYNDSRFRPVELLREQSAVDEEVYGTSVIVQSLSLVQLTLMATEENMLVE